jgi:DNA-binding NarL/FixJ family response regulator
MTAVAMMRRMRTSGAPPFVVVEGSDVAFRHAVAEVRAAGWTIVEGWTQALPRASRPVRAGRVEGIPDAEAALLAALDGVGLVIAADADREVTDRLVDDLRRLGQVEHRVGEPMPGPAVPPEARALLGLLAEGHSLGEAAEILGLARRTADRRLADARRALGVERTTAAIARARHLGWLGGGSAQGS